MDDPIKTYSLKEIEEGKALEDAARIKPYLPDDYLETLMEELNDG